MSESDKVPEPFVGEEEPNESYSEVLEDQGEVSQLPILLQESEDEEEVTEVEHQEDLKGSGEASLDQSQAEPEVVVKLPKSAENIAEKLRSLSEEGLQRMGDFLPFLEAETNAKIGRDGLKVELERLKKESQQYAENISSQRRVLQAIMAEKEKLERQKQELEESQETLEVLKEREESQNAILEASLTNQLERHASVFQGALSGINEIYLAEGLAVTAVARAFPAGNLQTWSTGSTKIHFGSPQAIKECWMKEAVEASKERTSNKRAITELLSMLKGPEVVGGKRPRTSTSVEEIDLTEGGGSGGNKAMDLQVATVQVETRRFALPKGTVARPSSLPGVSSASDFKANTEEDFLEILEPWNTYHPFKASSYEPADPLTYKKNVFRRMVINPHKLEKFPLYVLPVPECVVQDMNYGTPAHKLSGPKVKSEGKGPFVLILGTSLTVPWRLAPGQRTFCDNIRPEKASTRPMFDFEHLLEGRGIEVFQYSLSGWSALVGSGQVVSPAAIKMRVYRDLNLDSSFKFTHIFVRALYGYYDELSKVFNAPVLALGASAPPALGPGCNTYLTEPMDLDVQGVPLIPLRYKGTPIYDQRSRDSAGHAFQMALYTGLRTKIGKVQGSPDGKGWWAVPTPVRHLAAYDRTERTNLSFGHIHSRAYLFFAQLHAAAICFGLEWTQCQGKTWGAYACAGRCPQWLGDGKASPGIPPALPHFHCTDHGPKNCEGNGPFHINPAVFGAGGDPFKQMDEVLSAKMFLEVFSVEFLVSDPKHLSSSRMVIGTTVRVKGSRQKKFIISKAGDFVWLVGEGGLDFVHIRNLTRF
ncbi:unnamed protein product [Notodromas monacha]|uniref:Uncharacterized protein n=1 Tax=Notodromas monacha TaxID=399045 RepID=A0A7R9GCG7_9CRUS|nr:unnamed protein product [Notodromas monacha]CAG0917420.1 unnamed protein product [Notodromas monacha]